METTIAAGSAISGDAAKADFTRTPRVFDVPCTITVEQSSEHFHAHVDLPETVLMEAGDKIRIHGDPISIPFGSREIFERSATVTRASPLKRALVRAAAYFDLAELYEVSFNAGRIK